MTDLESIARGGEAHGKQKGFGILDESKGEGNNKSVSMLPW